MGACVLAVAASVTASVVEAMVVARELRSM